ncbi:hypothetical protein IHE61_09210 [Streptomyces sp. GKU 257-1]|nr:hypothetical protein [Streptomyces sp. GKU 257-1]
MDAEHKSSVATNTVDIAVLLSTARTLSSPPFPAMEITTHVPPRFSMIAFPLVKSLLLGLVWTTFPVSTILANASR